MPRTIIGVMGGSTASQETQKLARELGRAIAQNGWVLLNGGRNGGVMAASAAGARAGGGLVIGVLPDKSAIGACPDLDVAIVTGMGDARNAINVLSSDVVIAMAGGLGTLSEVALALKVGKHVVALGFDTNASQLQEFRETGQLKDVADVAQTIQAVQASLQAG